MNQFAAWPIFVVSLCAWLPTGIAEDIFYDETWAGPVRLAVTEMSSASANISSSNTTTEAGFDTVEGTLVMPRLAVPNNPSKRVDQYTAAYWIGLDGFVMSGDEDEGTGTSMVRGLWQAGVFMSIWENGTSDYTGFYEW